MVDKESLIRARYAVSVLRVAKKASPQEAIKLIEGLSKDWLDMEPDGKIANARAEATIACGELASALRTNSLTLSVAWDRAVDTSARWLKLIEQA